MANPVDSQFSVKPPDPNVNPNWTNPETGISYSYNFTIGAWDVSGLTPAGDSRLPYRIETDKVLREGKEVRAGEPEIQLVDAEDNFTNVKFAGTNGVEVTSTASSIVIDGSQLNSPNLEEVLTAGNVSDKNIVLTNAENDALLLSPDEGRAMVGGFGDGVVPIYELRHTNSFQESSIVKLELDEDGKRFDIECDERAENIHFRFNEEPKLDINKTGDAVFAGKVQAQPGTEGNELVTYGQLLTVEEELEQLAPALERGAWTWVNTDTPGPGQYSIINQSDSAGIAQCEATYQQCLIDNAGDPVGASQCNRDFDDCKDQYSQGPTNDFSKTYALIFNRVDIKGVDHTFADVQKETLVEIFNDNDDGFLVAQSRGAAHPSESYVLIFADPVKSKGIANGVARVKVFELNDDPASLTNYIRKTGDTMTGQLSIDRESIDLTALQIMGQSLLEGRTILARDREQNSTSELLQIVGNKLLMQANVLKEGSSDDDWIEYNGGIKEDSSLVNKRYVDRQRANSGPSTYRWTFRKDGSTSVSPTNFQCAFNDPGTGDIIRFSRTAMTSVYEGDQNLGQRGNWTFFDSEENQPLISIWDRVGTIFRIKWSGTARYIKSTSQADFEVKIGTKSQGSSIDNSTVCWISIAGLF